LPQINITKGIKMKKLNIAAITTVLFFMFLIPVFADDAADLQKLQPLNPSEQSMYEKVKNNTPKLHEFIATRTYLRMVKPMIGGRDPWKIDRGELRKLPAYPGRQLSSTPLMTQSRQFFGRYFLLKPECLNKCPSLMMLIP